MDAKLRGSRRAWFGRNGRLVVIVASALLGIVLLVRASSRWSAHGAILQLDFGHRLARGLFATHARLSA